jgi:hypothetical protein
MISTALAASLAVVLMLSALLRPTHAVTLWLFMFPLEQVLQANGVIAPTAGILFNALCASVALACAARNVATGRASVRQIVNPVSITLAALMLLAVASLAWSAMREHAADQVRWNAPYIGITALLIPLCIPRIEDLAAVRSTTTLSGCILAASILTSSQFTFYAARANLDFGSGERGNPLAVAEAGGFMVICAIIGGAAGSGRWTMPIRMVSGVLGVGLCFASGSRGQLVAAAIAAFVSIPVAYPIRNARSLASIVVAVVGLTAVMYLGLMFFVTSDNAQRWSVESLTAGSSERLDFVRRYFEVWIKDPSTWLFGLGTMSFGLYVSIAYFVENLTIEILIELGLVGFSIYSILFVLTIRDARRLWKRRPAERFRRVDIAMLVAMLTYYFIIASKSFNIWTAYPLWLWVLLVGSFESRDRSDCLIAEESMLDRINEDFQRDSVPEANTQA